MPERLQKTIKILRGKKIDENIPIIVRADNGASYSKHRNQR